MIISEMMVSATVLADWGKKKRIVSILLNLKDMGYIPSPMDIIADIFAMLQTKQTK